MLAVLCQSMRSSSNAGFWNMLRLGKKAVRLGLRMVKGLATADAARIVAARADEPFASADDLWRRSGVPTAALVKLAEADAFWPSLTLQRRDALWAAAAAREARQVAELQEPEVALPSMRAGLESERTTPMSA